MTTLSSQADLEDRGFVGFHPVVDLAISRCRDVPIDPGVYVVVRPTDEGPRFNSVSSGGWFKGHDPTVAVAALRVRWLAGTPLLYIGKATSLRTRVRALVDYGRGKPIGHQGGRYLWQVDGCDGFLVGWRGEADPRAAERSLLADFEGVYGQLPFANLSH